MSNEICLSCSTGSTLPRHRLAALILAVSVALTACSPPNAPTHPAAASPAIPSRTAVAAAGQTPTPAAAPTHFTATELPWRLPNPLSRAVALPEGTTLLLMGGLTPSGTSSADILRINPSTGKSTRIATLSQPVHDAGGARLGSRYVVFGGGAETVLGAVQAYTPGQASSTIIGRLPRLRADLTVAGNGTGTAYVVGGFDGAKPDSSVLATTDGTAFKTIATLPVPVRYGAAAAMGNYLWVIGGDRGTAPTTAIQRISLATGAATVTANLPAALDHAVAVVIKGTMLVLGGIINGHPSSIIWRLDPTTGTVVKAGTLPQAVSMPAAAVVSGAAYLLGGESATTLGTVIRIQPTN
nr:kelch-like protein [Arthrobacter silviterrae]